MLPLRNFSQKSSSNITSVVRLGQKDVGPRGRVYTDTTKDKKEIPRPKNENTAKYDKKIDKPLKHTFKKRMMKEISKKIDEKIDAVAAPLTDSIKANANEVSSIKAQATQHHGDIVDFKEHRVQSEAEKIEKDTDIADIKKQLAKYNDQLAAVPKEVADKIFSSPELLSEALKRLNEVLKNPKSAEMLNAVLNDSEIKKLLIQFCCGTEDAQIKQDGRLKSIYNKVNNKINLLTRPQAQVDFPATLIAGAILGVIIASAVYLYNVSGVEGKIEDHIVKVEDKYKDVDAKKLVDLPPKLRAIIKESQKLNKLGVEHNEALLAMMEPTQGVIEYVMEVNPMGRAEWIDKGLQYYNNPENAEYIKTINNHIEKDDNYYKGSGLQKTFKTMLDAGNLQTDYGKASIGIMAEENRLRVLFEKHTNATEEYNLELRTTHLALQRKVSGKLDNLKNDGAIDDHETAQYQNKLSELNDIEKADFLQLNRKNNDLLTMNAGLDLIKPKSWWSRNE